VSTPNLVVGEWWEIEGKGRWPEEGTEELIRDRVRDGEGWAIAWGLLEVARAIRGKENGWDEGEPR
jgi:hypothetical protein